MKTWNKVKNKMFGKLKEKLKSALSIFSRKAEEAAEKKEIVVEKIPEEKVSKKIPKKEEEKTEIITETPIKEVEKKKKEIKKEEKTEESYPKKDIPKKEIKKTEDKRKEELKKEIKEAEERKKEIPTKEKFPQKKEAERSHEKMLPAEEKPEEEPAAEKKSFFGRIKQAITTKTISSDKFEDLFWELELILLENNVSVEVIEKIKDDLKKELVGKPLPRDVPQKIEDTLKETLMTILSTEKINLLNKIREKRQKPFVIAFFGVNGAGKTTSIAKLTYYLQKEGYSVVLAACDTFRAAAIQQLEEHAEKLKVKVIKHNYGSDAAAVAFDAVKYAEKNQIDIVLIDTAGRLHSNTNLMSELEKIIRVTKPDFKIFVGESITGNDCIEQARKFNELVEMDGAILTKADVDEKGGAPLSISYVIKKPILFLGVGQNYDDFEKFDAEAMLKRLGF